MTEPPSNPRRLRPDPAAVFDAFAEPAALIGPGGRIWRVNAGFTEHFGAAIADASLDDWLCDPLDRHAAPWRRGGPGSGAFRALVKTADGGECAAQITVRGAGAGVLLATLTIQRADRDAQAVAETRLDIATRLGELSAWRYDFDTAEGWVEGPLAGPFNGFGPAAWRGRVHPDDLGALTAAFLAMEFGGGFDQRFRVRGEDGRWRLHHACGAREPGFGPNGRRASGFVRDAGGAQGEVDADPAEAAASAQMSAWTYDVTSRRLRLTGPVLERLGLPQPVFELDILDWRARLPTCDHAQMDQATRDLEARGVTEVEYRVRAQNGELVWLTLRGGVSEQDASGAVLRFSGFLSEISPRKQLEHKLAERERQLSEAVDAGLIGIWSIDMSTGAQRVHGRLASWMKAGPDGEVEPAQWRAVIHPDEFAKARAAHEAVRAGRAFRTFDYRLAAPEGWRWARTTGQIVESDPAGRPLRAAGVVIDISAERAFARALAAEKRRFETIYQNTPALMHSVDADGRTIMVSDYWSARMGYAREEAAGAPGWRFFIPDDQARVRDDILPRSMREGVIKNVPLTALTRSGEPIEVRLSAFWERDEIGRPVRAHGVFAEVGDLNEARRELEAQNEALERVNRELGRFTTVASHDLQEPLRKISAFASLLRRRYSGSIDPDADQSLEYLVDAAGRMRTLIDDLLAYSRASSRAVAFEPIALSAVWAETLEGHDLQIAEAEAHIEAGPLPAVRGDRVLLKLLFANLLSNALKYRKGPGVRISLQASAERGAVRLVFADDGIGFDQSFAEKVFEPFSRLHGREEYAGTGIGLAICQQAVERQGGRIWVETAPGAGARFHITLPAEAQSGATAGAA
ncbi:MAG: PAS domain-containing protein [Oceanicaulis sp.]